MKLTIVPCHSFFYQVALDTIKRNVDIYADSECHCLKEMTKRRICLSPELVKELKFQFNEKYNAVPEMVEKLNRTLNDLFNQANQVEIIKELKTEKVIESITDSYNKSIFKTVNSTEDKILLTDLFVEKQIQNDLKIEVIKSEEIRNPKKFKNILNEYRLPINRNIQNGEDSYQLGKWLEKFLKKSEEIAIIDPFFYANSGSIFKYLFKRLDPSIKLHIYMKHPEEQGKKIDKVLIRSYIEEIFENYSNIKIYIFKKEDQHDRFITNESYYLYLGKGSGIFGGKKTGQSEVRINEKKDINVIIPNILEEI